jgi:hypothetical protein
VKNNNIIILSFNVDLNKFFPITEKLDRQKSGYFPQIIVLKEENDVAGLWIGKRGVGLSE